jgi:haloalkane dehalogenase
MIDPKMRYAKQKITVRGRQMAYVDVGAGDAIVFIHGNANSAYMWRNIMPYLEGAGRLIAIDNIGQGDSDKLPNSGPGSYTLAEHQSYIDGALDALDVGDRVTLVMHDWGGPLGLTWAHAHPGRIKGLAHCEIVVRNHPSYDDYPDGHGERLRKVRGPDGEKLVLDDNYFVEAIYTGGVMRQIDDETMAEIRRPYEGPPENRRPTLTWPRQIPIEGKPKEVADLVEMLSAWMDGNDIPKLFIRAEPGQILFGEDFDIITAWPNQTTITVPGLHHPQEDSPDQIGQGLADWYKAI